LTTDDHIPGRGPNRQLRRLHSNSGGPPVPAPSVCRPAEKRHGSRVRVSGSEPPRQTTYEREKAAKNA
jgi:hypothetical protein